MLQIIILVNGVGTFWLIGSKSSKARVAGFIWGLIGQPFWFYETASHHQWGFFFLSCFYFLAYIRGVKNNYTTWISEDKILHGRPQEDPRKTGLKNGLRQLKISELRRVIDYPTEMVVDTFNYQDGKFCPLAIGVGLDNMQEPSHEKVFDELVGRGYKVYNTRGIKGDFYTDNRLADLMTAAKDVLAEKELEVSRN